ncbi:MAG: GTP 3',8-cyclase MoaA [Paraclostridium sp.]|uniref:GTP 3',8-cyclase MoaA n=1 Tax=Paraclostridium sp. TaxID=2023273 RepID=UPI003F38566E
MIDKHNREIDYLRISLTDKCNLRCIYCMPQDIQTDNINNELSFEDYKTILKVFSNAGIKKVRFTGGEPLLYENLDKLIEYARVECRIDDICMTTNAIGLSNKINKLKHNGLKKVNISIDSLNEEKYKKITRGGDLNQVLEAIDKCIKLGIKVKINCVLIKGLNDDELYDFINITKDKFIDVRFIELMPIGEGLKIFKKGYVNLNETLAQIECLKPITFSEKSVASYYKIDNSKGRVGIITPMSCSFCNNCNRIRMTSNGNLKLCLHSKEEIDIKPYLKNSEKFLSTLKEFIYTKPEKHNLLENKKSDTNRNMYQIGG